MPVFYSVFSWFLYRLVIYSYKKFITVSILDGISWYNFWLWATLVSLSYWANFMEVGRRNKIFNLGEVERRDKIFNLVEKRMEEEIRRVNNININIWDKVSLIFKLNLHHFGKSLHFYPFFQLPWNSLRAKKGEQLQPCWRFICLLFVFKN